jgi:hypothetical protein
MKLHLALLTALVLLALIAAPLLAHHSVSKEFDQSASTTIQGVITKVEWVNPHAWITLETKDANGSISSWHLEMGSPNSLFRGGLHVEFLELNKPCSVEFWPARDGSKTASGRKLTFTDGKTFNISDKFADALPNIPAR